MCEIVIEAKDISVGHETPQERLAKIGAKVVLMKRMSDG